MSQKIVRRLRRLLAGLATSCCRPTARLAGQARQSRHWNKYSVRKIRPFLTIFLDIPTSAFPQAYRGASTTAAGLGRTRKWVKPYSGLYCLFQQGHLLPVPEDRSLLDRPISWGGLISHTLRGIPEGFAARSAGPPGFPLPHYPGSSSILDQRDSHRSPRPTGSVVPSHTRYITFANMSTFAEAEEKAYHAEMLESITEQIVHPDLAVRYGIYVKCCRRTDNLASYSAVIDPATEKKLIRRLDICIMPLFYLW